MFKEGFCLNNQSFMLIRWLCPCIFVGWYMHKLLMFLYNTYINTLMFKIHCLQWYSDNSSAEEKQLFTDEINVMKRVSDGNNPHVLKMLGCVTATNPMMLVLQFVPQGNLKNYLRAMKTADDVRDVIVSKFLPRCLLCRVPALCVDVMWSMDFPAVLYVV